MMKLLSALLPCAILLLCYTTRGAAHGRITSCCLKTSDTRVRMPLLQSYHLQKRAMCYGIDAVRFTTVKGTKICSDPSLPWTKKAVAFLQKRQKHQAWNSANSHDLHKLTPKHNSTSNLKHISHW
ncbi:C-C motif chemokine 26-like [Engraulis encrasicolus]|uniref:C-C motif chemokine 26-like n=1 Tax=Engraulis encrasicolus TaxID=184585 RepID=UPI002FD6701D